MEAYTKSDNDCAEYVQGVLAALVNDPLLEFQNDPGANMLLRSYKDINGKLQAKLRSFVNYDTGSEDAPSEPDFDAGDQHHADLAQRSDGVLPVAAHPAAAVLQPDSAESSSSKGRMDIDPKHSKTVLDNAHELQNLGQTDAATRKGKVAIPQGLRVAAGAPEDDPGWVFVLMSYSDYGMNKAYKPNSGAMHTAIKQKIANLPKICQNILGKDVPASRIRLILLDGVKGNVHFSLLDKVKQDHVPKGSGAGDYLKLFETLKPDHVIVLGPRANSTCLKGMRWFFEQVNVVRPEVIFHYVMKHGGERFTVPDLTPSDMLKALNDAPTALSHAKGLLELIRAQSQARVELHVSAMRLQLKGGGMHRNGLGDLAADGRRMDPQTVVGRFDWPEAKSCSDLITARVGDENRLRLAGCAKMLVSEEDALFHLISEHYDAEDPQGCMFCGDHFLIPSANCKHLAAHLMARDRTCAQPACALTAAMGHSVMYNMYTLDAHRLRVHGGSKGQSEAELKAAETMQRHIVARMNSLFGMADRSQQEEDALTAQEEYLDSLFEEDDEVSAVTEGEA